MIPGLYAAGRALWRDQPRAGAWAGVLRCVAVDSELLAAGINRIGSRSIPAADPPLGVVASSTGRIGPSFGRFFGFPGGPGHLHLPARITPLLWLALLRDDFAGARQALRPT
jgi:hypothetical protein